MVILQINWAYQAYDLGFAEVLPISLQLLVTISGRFTALEPKWRPNRQ